MDMSEVVAALTVVGVPVHPGYAPTGAEAPYIVVRPMAINPNAVSLQGRAIGWDDQLAAYCCADSVEASYNLAKSSMSHLDGLRLGDSTASVSMGYTGAKVEGLYESQVTIQSDQGAL